MAVKLLTVEQHQSVVERLTVLARSASGTRFHEASPEYTSLMICFLLHNMSASETLLKLVETYGNQWFPATIGYVIVRSMFETEVTAHYIAQDAINRSRQYIYFQRVLDKREMDTCAKYCNSPDPQWRDVMNLLWENEWKPKQHDIDRKYQSIRPKFESRTKKGKKQLFKNWAGKSLRQMAREVAHEEAYEVFYAELSSFAHVDVRLANSFLRIAPDGLSWTQCPRERDIGNVFRHSANFMTCFLKLFAEQFGVWSISDVDGCWEFNST